MRFRGGGKGSNKEFRDLSVKSFMHDVVSVNHVHKFDSKQQVLSSHIPGIIFWAGGKGSSENVQNSSVLIGYKLQIIYGIFSVI